MSTRTNHTGPLPRALFRVSETAEILGLGRSKTYQLIQDGMLRTVKIGRAIRIPASAIEEFVQRVEEESCRS